MASTNIERPSYAQSKTLRTLLSSTTDFSNEPSIAQPRSLLQRRIENLTRPDGVQQPDQKRIRSFPDVARAPRAQHLIDDLHSKRTGLHRLCCVLFRSLLDLVLHGSVDAVVPEADVVRRHERGGHLAHEQRHHTDPYGAELES